MIGRRWRRLLPPKGAGPRRVLLEAAVALAALELARALFLEARSGGVLFALLLLVGAFWLSRAPDARPVVYTGLLCALELVFVLATVVAEGTASAFEAGVLAAAVAVSAIGALAAAAVLRLVPPRA